MHVPLYLWPVVMRLNSDGSTVLKEENVSNFGKTCRDLNASLYRMGSYSPTTEISFIYQFIANEWSRAVGSRSKVLSDKKLTSL